MREENTDRVVLFAKLSVAFNAVVAIVKLLAGIYSLSIFMGLSAFYSAGIGLAKLLFIKGYATAGKAERCCATIGLVILIASVIYIFYSIRMFIGISVNQTRYPMGVAIAIAAITFTDIGISAKSLVSLRKSEVPLLQAAKLTSLASSLIGLVLTQTAILSFTLESNDVYTAMANGLAGVVFGGCAAMIGVYMIIRNKASKPSLKIMF